MQYEACLVKFRVTCYRTRFGSHPAMVYCVMTVVSVHKFLCTGTGSEVRSTELTIEWMPVGHQLRYISDAVLRIGALFSSSKERQ